MEIIKSSHYDDLQSIQSVIHPKNQNIVYTDCVYIQNVFQKSSKLNEPHSIRNEGKNAFLSSLCYVETPNLCFHWEKMAFAFLSVCTHVCTYNFLYIYLFIFIFIFNEKLNKKGRIVYTICIYRY